MTRLANLQLIASVGLLAAVSNPVLHSNYNSEDPGPPPATTSHPADDDGDDWSTSGQQGLVTYSDHKIIPHGKCEYFHSKALETAHRSWWERFRKCESG